MNKSKKFHTQSTNSFSSTNSSSSFSSFNSSNSFSSPQPDFYTNYNKTRLHNELVRRFNKPEHQIDHIEYNPEIVIDQQKKIPSTKIN